MIRACCTATVGVLYAFATVAVPGAGVVLIPGVVLAVLGIELCAIRRPWRRRRAR